MDSRYVPSTRMESTRGTARPSERGSVRPSGRDSERDTTRAGTHRESRRGESKAESRTTKRGAASSSVSRAERLERELETSTATTLRAGSVIGTDSSRRSGARHDRTARLDTAGRPSTIYEDEDEEYVSRVPASRYDTGTRGGHLVPYNGNPTTGGGSLFDAPSRAGRSHAPSTYGGDMATTRGGRGDSQYPTGTGMTRRGDQTFSGAVRSELARPGNARVEALQVKIETASGTRIEFNMLDVRR